MKFFDLFPTQKETDFGLLNILKIAFLLPVIEELIFRLPLKISKVNITVPLSIVLFLVTYKLNIYIAIILTIILVLFLIIFLKTQKGLNILSRMDSFFSKYFHVVFYLQAILFGFLHLSNYSLNYKYFYLFPFFAIS